PPVRSPTARRQGTPRPGRRSGPGIDQLGCPPPGSRAARDDTGIPNRSRDLRNGLRRSRNRAGPSGRDQVPVGVGPPIPIELPGLPDLLDEVEVHVADQELLVVRAADRAHELAARVDEVALAVEVVRADVGLDADA